MFCKSSSDSTIKINSNLVIYSIKLWLIELNIIKTAYPLRASVVINKDSSLCLPAAGRFEMTIKNLLNGWGERLAKPASLPTASTD